MTAFGVFVEVRLRPGIADPAGATIERALPALGFGDVHGVRTAKAFRFVVDAADEQAARARVDELCRRLLTNPVIEDAAISLEPGPTAAASSGDTGDPGDPADSAAGPGGGGGAGGGGDLRPDREAS